MPPASINEWLKKKRSQGILASTVYAAVTFAGGVVFLGLTSWIVFMAAKVVLLSAFGLSWWVTPASVIAALLVCAFLFYDSVNSPRDDMSSVASWLLREYIDIGPRLMLEVFPAAAKIRRWKRFDVEACGRVLMFLAGREAPSRKSDLLRIFPELDWDSLREELKLISGVIFFQPDGFRVTLTLPLRLELRAFRTRKRVSLSEPPPEPEPTKPFEPQPLSPAELLGVPADASVAEVKAAYRRRIKECHPDRFAMMDETSRAAAEEWTKSLNAAYEAMLAAARTRRTGLGS